MNIKNQIASCFRNPAYIDLAMLLIVGMLMLSVLWSDAHSPWAFSSKEGSVTDNYFIALNAKNISEGKGWGLYNGFTFVPFEREISTGPVVFLPVALMMKLVSDADNARYLGVILLDISLLLVLLTRLKLFFSREIYRSILLLTPFVLLAFMREQWYLVLGEVAASLLLLISATYAAEKIVDRKNIFLSGFFSGMALMSKLISILCSPWIIIVLSIVLVSHFGVKASLKKISLWLGGFFIVPALVALWHLIVFDGSLEKLLEYSLDYLNYYFGLGWTGNMESTFCPDPYCLNVNFLVAASAWPNHYGLMLAGMSLLIPVIGAFLFFKKNKQPADYLLIIVAGMCFAQFLFFYFNGIHRQSRYYFIGGFIGLFAVFVLWAVCLNQLSSFKLRLAVLAVIFIVVVDGARPLFRDYGPNHYQRDIKNVAAYINQNPAIDELLWLSFGSSPFPFSSYYLNNKTWWSVYGFAGNKFKFSTEKLQVDADFYWKDQRNYFLLLEKWQEKPLSANVCAIERFHNEYFRVLECRPSEIETFYIAMSGGKMRFPKSAP